MIRIFIADDHEMFRDGIKSLLNSFRSISVVGEATNGEEVLERLKTMEVDVVLLDISMPGINGIEAATMLLKQNPDVKILMLSMFNDAKHIQEVIKSGAKGYVLKDCPTKELVDGIQTVFEGGTFFVDEVKEKLINSFKTDEVHGKVVLTKREQLILEMICEDMTTPQIAEKLTLSVHTVESHRKNLLMKTGAKTSIGLVRFAVDNGYIKR